MTELKNILPDGTNFTTAPDQSADLPTRIIASLERFSAVFTSLLAQQSIQNRLEVLDLQVLIYLSTHTSAFCNYSSLNEEFEVEEKKLNQVISKLEEKKLLVQMSPLAEGLQSTYSLTQEGKSIAARASGISRAIANQINLADRTDQANLLFALLTSIYHLELNGIISNQRMCLSCKHYEPQDGKSYCRLLGVPLSKASLRLDCDEHEG